MPAAFLVFITVLGILVWADPAGIYHPQPVKPKTPTEVIQDSWWAAQFAAGLSADNKTHDEFLAQEKERLLRECNEFGVDPKEVFK